MDENTNATMDSADDTSQESTDLTSTDATSVDASSDESQDSDPAPKTTRDHLSEAFDRLQKDGEAKAKAKADQGPGKRKVEAPKTDKVPAKTAPDAVQKDVDPISGRELEPVKAPQSMPASLRETWKDMPRAHQEYWAKREQDMAQNYGRLGAGAKFAESIQKAAKPIEAFIKQVNLPLEKVTQGLYADAAVLWTGTPQQKAQMIDRIIRTTQPDMQVLSALAAGKNVNVQAPPKPIDIDAEVEKRIQAREQENANKQSQDLIESFRNDPANEFIHYTEFADKLELQMGAAIEQGFIPMEGKTHAEILKAAYDFAVKNNAQIQGILAARGQQPNGQQQPAAGKPVVKAVRSAKPSPGAGIASKQPAKKYSSTRDAASAAWDELYGAK